MGVVDNKVYVIMGSHGEYSDREEYVYGVYWDLKEAIEIATQKLAEARAMENARNAWYSKYYKLCKELYPDQTVYGNKNEDHAMALCTHRYGPLPSYEDCMWSFTITEVPIREWAKHKPIAMKTWHGLNE